MGLKIKLGIVLPPPPVFSFFTIIYTKKHAYCSNLLRDLEKELRLIDYVLSLKHNRIVLGRS